MKREQASAGAGLPIEAHRVLGDLLQKEVVVNGVRMSIREAYLRQLYRASLSRDMGAAMDLQKIRDAAKVSVGSKEAGYLVVPEEVSLEEWERLAFEQQAKFRTRDSGDGS